MLTLCSCLHTKIQDNLHSIYHQIDFILDIFKYFFTVTETANNDSNCYKAVKLMLDISESDSVLIRDTYSYSYCNYIYALFSMLDWRTSQ